MDLAQPNITPSPSDKCSYRMEHDLLGTLAVPQQALYGIHTMRAIENFPLSHRLVHPEMARAYGAVKLACALTNQSLGVWDDDPEKGKAIVQACREMADGDLLKWVVVDALHGGAGTPLNMNVNEVIANRALEILGEEHGMYQRVSPVDDVNRYQSTNDTFPTALRLAAIRLLQNLETRVIALQEAFQSKEKEFVNVVKVGRTELQDAVLITLGREMGAYAEAFNRDRWRIYKCEERLRTINLGGTAIGTGIAAPRQYIFRVADTLREITGIGFARAENLVEATQNSDVIAEVSGMLKVCATSLLKICADLRLLSSGPEAGLGEIALPKKQAGSSIMPGKVNPVIPEAVSQAAMLVISHDQTISIACASGNLELNPFLPLMAVCLLDSCDLLANACDIMRRHCVDGIIANETACRRHVESSTATLTAIIPVIGYEKATEIAIKAAETRSSIRDLCVGGGLISEERFDALTRPEAVCRLGSPEAPP